MWSRNSAAALSAPRLRCSDAHASPPLPHRRFIKTHTPLDGVPLDLRVHYDDLLADLGGEMRRLADRWGIPVAAERWPELVEAATFGRMRERADRLAPDSLGVLSDRQAFFRQGRSGQGRTLLDASAQARYQERVSALGPPDLLSWLHR